MNRRNAAGLACLVTGLLAVVGWLILRPTPGPTGGGPAAGPVATVGADAPAPRDLAASPRGEAPQPRASEGPAPAEAARRLTFRVADAAGTPIAGARVWVHHPNGVDWGAPTAGDAAGVAVVERVPIRKTYFHAVVPGYRAYFGGLEAGPPADGSPVPLTLEPGVAASLRVVTADGATPVPGATVGLGASGNPLPLGATDANGTMALPGLGDNDETTFVVSTAGFRTAVVKLRADGGRPEREVTVVRLERGGTIRGIVLGPDGRAMPEVTVRARTVAELAEDAAEAWPAAVPADVAQFLWGRRLFARSNPAFQISDRNGRFVFDGLELGAAYGVSASVSGHAAAADVADVLPTTDAAPGRDVELRIRRPAVLLVRCTVPDGANPPHDVRVDWATSPPSFPRRPARAEADGRVRLVNVVPGRVLVFAETEGFLPAATFVHVAEGATIEVDLPLSTGATVVGTVVDVGGLPLADASVVIDRWSVDGLPGAPSIRTRTDRSGRFSVSGVWPGPIHLHVTWKDERGPAAGAYRVPATAPARDLRIVLVPEGRVRMRLLDADRRPYLRRVQVMLSTDGGGKGGTREPDDGVLSHDGLSDGDYVWVVCPSDAAWVTRTFSVRGGRAIDLGDVVLDVGATITGRALDPAGHPIADAKVRCPEVEDFRWTRTDAEGRFTMEHVPRTAVRLVFETDDRYMERTVDPSDPSPVEVRLLQRRALR